MRSTLSSHRMLARVAPCVKGSQSSDVEPIHVSNLVGPAFAAALWCCMLSCRCLFRHCCAQFVLLVGCIALAVYTATQVFGWHGYLIQQADGSFGE
jgi:hypothetical protein